MLARKWCVVSILPLPLSPNRAPALPRYFRTHGELHQISSSPRRQRALRAGRRLPRPAPALPPPRPPARERSNNDSNVFRNGGARLRRRLRLQSVRRRRGVLRMLLRLGCGVLHDRRDMRGSLPGRHLRLRGGRGWILLQPGGRGNCERVHGKRVSGTKRESVESVRDYTTRYMHTTIFGYSRSLLFGCYCIRFLRFFFVSRSSRHSFVVGG